MGGKGSRKKKAFPYKQKGKQSQENEKNKIAVEAPIKSEHGAILAVGGGIEPPRSS